MKKCNKEHWYGSIVFAHWLFSDHTQNKVTVINILRLRTHVQNSVAQRKLDGFSTKL